MPFLSPMVDWVYLLYFSITFMLFSMMNYYSVIPQSPKSDSIKKSSTQPLNWKW
uniref:ATPase 8 n=1 Tax=Anastrepha obliqua TaxID=95512 RepID=Q0PJA8_9MUSC|nr:ATPase 8 [Anastrepha obliqua]